MGLFSDWRIIQVDWLVSLCNGRAPFQRARREVTTIAVTGGRTYSKRARVYQILDAAVKRLGMTELVVGDADGLDRLARAWARERGFPMREFKADWNDLTQPGARIRTRRDGSKYDANAGPRRNGEMLRQGRPSKLIGFPGGDGTRDCISQARRLAIEVLLIDWDG